MSEHPDPVGVAVPAWMADVARKARSARLQFLIDAMLEQDEDVTDNDLWRTRREQFDALIAAGQAEAAARP